MAASVTTNTGIDHLFCSNKPTAEIKRKRTGTEKAKYVHNGSVALEFKKTLTRATNENTLDPENPVNPR